MTEHQMKAKLKNTAIFLAWNRSIDMNNPEKRREIMFLAAKDIRDNDNVYIPYLIIREVMFDEYWPK